VGGNAFPVSGQIVAAAVGKVIERKGITAGSSPPLRSSRTTKFRAATHFKALLAGWRDVSNRLFCSL
jgi:hypothetical protein